MRDLLRGRSATGTSHGSSVFGRFGAGEPLSSLGRLIDDEAGRGGVGDGRLTAERLDWRGSEGVADAVSPGNDVL